MSKINTDGIIKDWGDELFPSSVKGKKGKNIRGGKVKESSSNTKSQLTMGMISRTVHKVPEVMVKISGGGKNMQHIKAHMDYISRINDKSKDDVELEDEQGNIYLGKDDIDEVRDIWAKGKIPIPEQGERRKEAFNIVLSMPPGTHRQSVKDAARDFAKSQFSDHQYLFAAHEDEKHPHVHLTVKAVSHKGKRLNPRKRDLQKWREKFAEKLRENGIEANATPRRTRGIVQDGERQVAINIDKEFKKGKREKFSKITQKRNLEAKEELESGTNISTPKKVKKGRGDIQKAYGEIAKTLVKGDKKDRELALEITRFVKDMPLIETKQQERLRTLSEEQKKDSPHDKNKSQNKKEQSKEDKSKEVKGKDLPDNEQSH